jgi:DNA-binding MarR family transcriptional regulator
MLKIIDRKDEAFHTLIKNVIIMKQPFEGLFGDTCETRLLQFLLPMYGIEFDMADLTEEIKLTRQSVSKAMKKFSNRGMVKIRKEGRTWFYSINEDSPLVKRLEDFDNSLIESMLGREKFREIQKSHEKRVRVSSQKAARLGDEQILTASCVASGPGNYLKEKV